MLRKLIRLLHHAWVYVLSLLSSGPSYLIIFVTGRCNLRCAHCFYLDEIEKADIKRELTLEEFTRVAKNSPVLYHITFTGGETFLRKDLNEIVQAFYRYSKIRSVTITTNGTYPQKVTETVESIAATCPNLIVRVPLSMDGTEKVHDEMRGLPGTWHKVLETYEQLRDVADRHSNVKLDITSVLTNNNLEDIEALIEFVGEKMVVDNHAINFPRGKMQDEIAIVPALERYDELVGQSGGQRKRQRYRFPIFSRVLVFMRDLTEYSITRVQKTMAMPFVCEAGERLVEINEYGELFPCEVLDTLITQGDTVEEPSFSESGMGNIRNFDYDLRKVLASNQARRVVNFIRGGGCACTFECAIGASLVFRPINILRIQLSRLKPSRFAKLRGSVQT